MNRADAIHLINGLYSSWYSWVVKYVVRVTGKPAEAEDIVQEAFMELYRQLRAGKQIKNPQGWVVRVVQRIIIRRRQQWVQEQWQEPLEKAGEQPLTSRQEALQGWECEQTRKLLGVLTPREEEVLLLRLDSLKYSEIARTLGISSNSVSTLLARALKKLKLAVQRKQLPGMMRRHVEH
jgi:RNA polymerase sigma-70 factor (ECF subfamily)